VQDLLRSRVAHGAE